MRLHHTGKSGLKVSPLCLGTMTFGEDWGWGASEDTAEIFTAYAKEGGNFFDTADGYTNGKSEELLGKFIKEGKLRDSAVIASKFTFNAQPATPTLGATVERTYIGPWKARSSASTLTIWTCTGYTPGIPSRLSKKCWRHSMTW
ncbi:MAG: aldo/keto reductase [Candidatus Obscuribacterales bacterium]